MVTTAKIKKWDDTNGRVEKGYDVYMYPQWVNFTLKDLDRCVLTVQTIQVLNSHLVSSIDTILPVMKLHGQ